MRFRCYDDDDRRNIMIDCGHLLLKYRGLNGRLKIGLVLGGRRGPLWVRSLIEFLGNVPGLELHFFIAGNGARRPSTAASGLADRLYTWSRRGADPFGEVDLDLGETVPEAAQETKRARKLGLLFCIPHETIPEGAWSDLARVWLGSIQPRV